MRTPSTAKREKKKEHVLKAVARLGKITDAARACNISRDAVHDWRRNDPAFASAFLIARAAFRENETLTMNDAVDFFIGAIRPFVPEALWPRIHSRIQIAVSERKFRERGRSDSRFSSRNNQVNATSPSFKTEVQATLCQGNVTLHRSF